MKTGYPHRSTEIILDGDHAHRRAAGLNGDRTAACNGVEGNAVSFGWARHIRPRVEPCRAKACFAAAPFPSASTAGPDRRWMSSRRRNADHHRLPDGAAKTPCGKYAGLNGGVLDNGMFVGAEEIASLNSKPCKTCWPEVARG